MGQVGFIGLGMMGSPMAINLLKAGFAVLVYDVSSEAVKNIEASGARAVATVSEMAGCDAVFIMVKSAPQVEDVLLGQNGLLKGMKKGQKLIVVVMSTISPTGIRRLSERTYPQGLMLVDAPVSGGPIFAQNAMLTFMIGGEEAAVNSIRPYAQAMGNNIFHVGSLGMGLAIKLINNVVALTNSYVFTEAIRISIAGGLNIKKLLEIINASSGRNWCSENWDMYLKVLSVTMNNASFSETVIKDIQTAIDWSAEMNIDSPILKAALLIMKSGANMPEAEEMKRKLLSIT